MTQGLRVHGPADALKARKSALMPNLFIIGASKAGTSALHAYLRCHPGIRMSDEKEPCFFVDPVELHQAWPIMARNRVSHEWNAYLSLYAGGEIAAYRGEASVYYSQSPHRSGVPERIAAASPEARIIYLVREPVSRAISHFWQRKKEFQEPLELPEAIELNALYRDTSDYAMQLSQYLTFFDRRQIRVVVAEDLLSDRRRVLGELLDWLGVPPYAYSDAELAEVHISLATTRVQRFPFVKRVRDSGVWAKARASLPKPLVAGLRRAATKHVPKSEVDDRPVRAWLSDYLKPRTAAFEALVGRRFNAW